MENNLEHIAISRIEPVNDRRPRPGFGANRDIANPRLFAAELLESMHAGADQARSLVGGFDDRLLLKFETEDHFVADDLLKISSDIEVVAQEQDGVVLAFASDEALRQFESKLTDIMSGVRPTYQNLIFALDRFSTWTSEDRMGWSLKNHDIPTSESFDIDVELLPVDSADERAIMAKAFEAWLREQKVDWVDKCIDPELVLYRITVTANELRAVATYRDVRKIDLPPDFAMDRSWQRFDIQDVADPPPPPDDAPRVAILDTGVQSNHPLLAPAIGDVQQFCSTDKTVPADDTHGHGTHVAGLVLYHDVFSGASTLMKFEPSLWILSGRVLDSRAGYRAPRFRRGDGTQLIQNDIQRAVEEFHSEYGCRIFNLSFRDLNRVYRGGRMEGLSVKLDALARRYDVLFIVSAGNFDDMPTDVLTTYPRYLYGSEARICDPATALNVITVGSIARYDATRNMRKYPWLVSERPIARRNQPSPFSRTGHTVGGAIKPDFIAYGGNWAVDVGNPADPITLGLGEVSTAYAGLSLGPLGEQGGTSFAAPHVTHVAARLLSRFPQSSANFLRAMLAAHSSVPAECREFGLTDDELLRLCGYGAIEESALVNSSEYDVTMYADDEIENDKVHFYEVPVPASFFSTGKRRRDLSVALSYMPAVRTTRLNYRATRMSFHLIRGSVSEAVKSFNAATAKQDYESISEHGNRRSVTNRDRSRGTLQAARWQFMIGTPNPPKFVVVVSRDDFPWAERVVAEKERYSLVIRMADLHNSSARLHSEIVQIRAQAKTKARVRV